MTAATAKTAEEAMTLALAWAEGKRSHWSTMLGFETSPDDRATTWAQCTFADAQEVVKWTAIAVAYEALERRS